MTVRLTDTAIAKAKREAAASNLRRELSDAACRGLRLRVKPNGAGDWMLACRDREGRMRRFPLGAWPTMGIGEARVAAQSLHTQVRLHGADPVADRRRERAAGRAAREGIGTLAALLALFGRDRGAQLRSRAEYRKRISDVFRPLLDRPLVLLTAGQLQMQADRHGAVQSASAAVRYLRPILKWGAKRGYCLADLAAIEPRAPTGRRDRVLSRDELAAVLPVLRQSGRPYAAAMLFGLLTCARREEAAGAQWGDIDMRAGTWTLRQTKNRQVHVVPLSRQALALLAALRPADADPAALVFATRTGGRLVNWDRETKAIQAASGTAAWTRHDLRRTGATLLGELGVVPDIIEAALNHVAIRSALAATYNRSRYRPQVADALQRLGDLLDGIEAGAAVVVPLRA